MNLDWLSSTFSDVVNVAQEIWNLFISIIPTVDTICMSLIAYYTFRLTVFPKKLKFISFKQSFSSFEGDSMEITLENRSLCPCVIESVELIVDSYKIKFFDGEYTIDGFKTAKLQMEPYSQIVAVDGEIKIDVLSLNDMSVLVKTTRGIQHIRYEKCSRFAYWRTNRLESKHKRTTVCRKYHNEKLVVPGIKYAISFIDKSENLQTFFIHKSGIMSQSLFGYNHLSNELINDKTSLIKHFDEEFQKYDLKYFLTEFQDTFITDDSVKQ